MRISKALVVAGFFVALAGCGAGEKTGASPSPSLRPSSSAQLSITAPRNGESLTGPKVRVIVGLENARIVELTTTDVRPDTGHLHVKLDGELLTMTAGLSFEIPDAKPGSHVLQVEFVAADHVPFEPRVFAGVTFRVA